MSTESISLYVHIPFCKQKCKYCDFLSGAATAETRHAYALALIEEIKEKAALYGHPSVKTVFFGGGTPTAMELADLLMIIQGIRDAFAVLPGAEWSMECNPGLVDTAGFQALLKAGVNRLSIGLQSADDAELATLGRIHDYDTFLQCYQDARKAGFQNINIDLMMAIPGQNLTSFQRTLQKVVALEPEHLSIYSLIIEEGTPFYELYGKDDAFRAKTGEASGMLCSEKEERDMYHLTEKELQKAGFHRYEISNYAKEGKECQHNLVYWRRGLYLGVGLGAASLMDGLPEAEPDREKGEVRFHITNELQAYLAGDYEPKDVEMLNVEDAMSEFVFLGLRCQQGISKKVFEKTFAKSLSEVYGDKVEDLKQKNLLEESGEWIKLTEKGTDLANIVFAEFV